MYKFIEREREREREKKNDFQVHNFREFPGHRSRIIDVRQRVEVEVFSKIVSALCFTKHVVIKVKNLLMQKLNLIITNHATSSIKCKKYLPT